MAFNRFNHSVLGEIRPRFKLKIPMDPNVAIEEVAKRLYNDNTVSGEHSGTYIFLRIPSWQQHYWSPEMSVRIEEEEYTDYTTVSCLIGPRQTVWAMFVFLYSLVILLSTFGGIYGLVKYQETGLINWLWVIPTGVLLTSTLFIVSRLGQQKGRDQMLHLVSFIYHALDDITEVERMN